MILPMEQIAELRFKVTYVAVDHARQLAALDIRTVKSYSHRRKMELKRARQKARKMLSVVSTLKGPGYTYHKWLS